MKALIGKIRIKKGVILTYDLAMWCVIYGKNIVSNLPQIK